MKIAIVGAGLAGLATASFLRREGHEVTVFERDEKLEGRGLGLVVQPLGLSVLQQLGLKDKVAAAGARIDHMHILKMNSGRTISDMHYSDLERGLFGVGIHRARLYEILLEKARELGVKFTSGCGIEDAVMKGDQRELIDDKHNSQGTFDLVVDSSGYRSPLRAKYAKITRQKPYALGFVCGTCDDDHSLNDAGEKKLSYRFHNGHAMTLIPIGKDPVTGKDRMSFFWSMPTAKFDPFNFDVWKKEVLANMPAAKPYIDQITSKEQLVRAQYADVTLKNYYADKMVFIGDSAHSTSPLLGQSTSMGFTDGLILSKILARQPNLDRALRAYSHARKAHIHFQQEGSRTLTHLFQSVSLPVKLARDLGFPELMHIPGVHRLLTLLTARAEPFLKNILVPKKFGI